MIAPPTADALLNELIPLLHASNKPLSQRLQQVMERLKASLPHFHWVGVYWLEGDVLVLGPYAGPPTEHTRIPVGRGVCGTAVAQNANQIVHDVRERDNYLACNLETRSEIVVLIRHPQNGTILGQIDVDGPSVGAFDATDEAFLERLGQAIAQTLLTEKGAPDHEAA